jgi:hypothetical protein
MTRPIRLLLVAVSIALVVAACGGGSSSNDAAGKKTTTAAASGATTTAASAGPGAGSSGKCKAGLGTVAGVQSRTFCGPATATVTVGSTALTFKGGQCESGTGYLTVNIGTVALGALKDPSQKPAYFGLVAGDLSKAPGGAAVAGDQKSPAITGDGAYAGQPLITGNSGATAIVLKASTLTLSDGQKKGTFSGTGLDGAAVTGSFSCS